MSKLLTSLQCGFSSGQWLSRVRVFSTPWTAARQASLSIANSQSLLKLMSIESVMPSIHLILCCPLLLPPSIFPSISSVQFSRSVVSDSLQPHEPQHARPPCPSPTPGVHTNPCPLSRWCHPTISFSVVPFSSCPQSFPASGSFQMSQLFALGGQSIGVSASASVLPMTIQDWFPLGWTGYQASYLTWLYNHPHIMVRQVNLYSSSATVTCSSIHTWEQIVHMLLKMLRF